MRVDRMQGFYRAPAGPVRGLNPIERAAAAGCHGLQDAPGSRQAK